MENKFSYTYSAPKKAEVEKIRSKYTDVPVRGDERLEQLKKLDRSCETPGTIVGIVSGIIGTMIFAAGMTLLLKSSLLITGIIVVILGMAVMGSALPMYRKITSVRRKKLAPDIIRLSDEIEADIK